MTINVIDHNIVAQQADQGMTSTLTDALKDIERKDDEKRTEERSLARQVLDSKSPDKKGSSILADLISKLGDGFKFNARTESKSGVKDEQDLLFENKEKFDDKVDIRNTQAINKIKKFNKQSQEQNQKQAGQFESSKNINGTVKDYTAVYTQMLLNGGGELKKKLQKLEYQLQQAGLTQKQILGLQKDIKNAIRSQLAAQIKEGILKKMLSPERSIAKALNNSALDKTIEFAFYNKELGEWDFGGYNDSLQGTVDAKLEEAISEIKDFTREEIERLFVVRHLGKEGNDKQLKELLELASKVGFDAKQFLDDWQIKSFDLGLVPPPNQGNIQTGVNTDPNGRGDRAYAEFGFDSNDEKDLLINQLRACFMRRALHNDFKTVFETSFKMRRLKNGLIKLGVSFGDFEKLESEGRQVAVDKLRQMLGEALYERATLYSLSGPAYQLLGRRIKGITKNLERLGVVVSSSEFRNLIDSANHSMFETAKHEFEETKIIYESHPNPAAEKKLSMLKMLLLRLAEESGIRIDIDFNVIKRIAA